MPPAHPPSRSLVSELLRPVAPRAGSMAVGFRSPPTPESQSLVPGSNPAGALADPGVLEGA